MGCCVCVAGQKGWGSLLKGSPYLAYLRECYFRFVLCTVEINLGVYSYTCICRFGVMGSSEASGRVHESSHGHFGVGGDPASANVNPCQLSLWQLIYLYTLRKGSYPSQDDKFD